LVTQQVSIAVVFCYESITAAGICMIGKIAGRGAANPHISGFIKCDCLSYINPVPTE
jgi:hypothetical protein